MTLITERLLLRDFVREDWPELLAYQSDPRYLRFYPRESTTEKEARYFVRTCLAQQWSQPRLKYQLALVRRGHEAAGIIGNCGIRCAADGPGSADLGYELAPDQWGQGYATEAARAMVAFGFGTLGLVQISADCLVENHASLNVLRKLGFVRDDRPAIPQPFKGRQHTLLRFRLPRTAWQPSHP